MSLNQIYINSVYIIAKVTHTHYLQPLPGASLVLDPTSGLPVFQGTTPVQFTVMISRKVASSGKGGRIVAYGHGLFGDQNEITQDYLQENVTIAI